MRLANIDEKALEEFHDFVKEKHAVIKKIENFLNQPRHLDPYRAPRGCTYSQYRLAVRRLERAQQLFTDYCAAADLATYAGKGHLIQVNKKMEAITAEDCRRTITTVAQANIQVEMKIE